MTFKFSSLIVAVALPFGLAGCDVRATADAPYVAQPMAAQMMHEATGRNRVRDLRAEVTGNIDYLKSHVGEHRALILDMGDSLLFTLPGQGAFEARTDRLTETGIDAIERVAASMIEFPHTRIAVVGHVDGSKSTYADQILSERRAAAVKSVLMSRGIDECRIGINGKGSSDFIAVPLTQRKDQYNNRIEIMLKPFQDGACV